MNLTPTLTVEELRFLLAQGEGQFIEFKEAPDKSLAREIVAFANGTGGRILLGVTDAGGIKGIRDTNKLRSQIIDIGRNCDPGLTVHVEPCDSIVVVTIPESGRKPHACSGGFFLRVGANSQKLTRDEIIRFAVAQGIKSFDEEISDTFVYPDDFDDKKFDQYLKAARLEQTLSTEDMLINLDVAERDGDRLRLNHAGILFFARTPSRFLPSSPVVCAEFANNDKVQILDKKVYDDGILENIRQAIAYITKRIKVKFVIESAHREEIPQFPEKAYREGVVNAIMHRDYIDRSSDVFVECYLNQLILINPGGLVRWMNRDDFGKVSKARNPVIASLLARTDFVEKMGTGIQRINAAMSATDLPAPDYRFDEYTFFLTLSEFPIDRAERKAGQRAQVTAQVAAQVTAQVTAQVGAFCVEPRSARDIMSELGLRHWKTFQSNYLKPLINADFIEMTIPEKPKSRLQKYRLTQKGRALLDRVDSEGGS